MKKYNTVSILTISSAISVFAVAAQAAEPTAAGFLDNIVLTANTSLTTDYRYRGISQTDEMAALQAGFTASTEVAEATSLYVGAWASPVDFNDGKSNTEVDYIGGVTYAVGDLSLDTGFIYYSYPGTPSSFNYDFVEYQATVGYQFDPFFVKYSINYSPEFYADSGEALYNKLSAETSFYPNMKLSSYIAKQDVEDNAAYTFDDYYEWGFGATYSFVDVADVSLNYVSTNLSEADCASGCSGTVILSVSKTF